MSRARLAMAVLTIAALAALLAWQWRREQIAKACLEAGGVWHGPRSECRDPVRPILRRGLERS